MPTTTADPIADALRACLAPGGKQKSTLEDRLQASAKRFLLTSIAYEPAGQQMATVLHELKEKYVLLNSRSQLNGHGLEDWPIDVKNHEEDASLVSAPADFILEWKKNHPRGMGMNNFGYNCYQNAVLQALFHVPPFANWLLYQNDHSKYCKNLDKCVLCGVLRTLRQTLTSNSSVSPKDLQNKLTSICKLMHPDKQEDANEYMVYLLGKMHDCYVAANNRMSLHKITSSPLIEMFQGSMVSEVKCLKCCNVSSRIEKFRDIAVDISNVNNVQEALKKFFDPEILQSEYRCTHCCTAVTASKKFSLKRIPIVLCVQLKLFVSHLGKLLKKIACEHVINLKPFVHKPFEANVDPVYKLQAVVCHIGQRIDSGHYVALADTPEEGFFVFNDSRVHQLGKMNGSLGQPYILLYQLHSLEIGGAKTLLDQVSLEGIEDKFLGGGPPKIMRGQHKFEPRSRAPPTRACKNDSMPHANGIQKSCQLPPLLSPSPAPKLHEKARVVSFANTTVPVSAKHQLPILSSVSLHNAKAMFVQPCTQRAVRGPTEKAPSPLPLPKERAKVSFGFRSGSTPISPPTPLAKKAAFNSLCKAIANGSSDISSSGKDSTNNSPQESSCKKQVKEQDEATAPELEAKFLGHHKKASKAESKGKTHGKDCKKVNLSIDDSIGDSRTESLGLQMPLEVSKLLVACVENVNGTPTAQDGVIKMYLDPCKESSQDKKKSISPAAETRDDDPYTIPLLLPKSKGKCVINSQHVPTASKGKKRHRKRHFSGSSCDEDSTSEKRSRAKELDPLSATGTARIDLEVRSHVSKPSATWDGSTTSKGVRELNCDLGMGFGKSVIAWGGRNSEVNKVMSSGSKPGQKTEEELFNEDLDKGKERKLKGKKSKFLPDGNPFQKLQDTNNLAVNGYEREISGEQTPQQHDHDYHRRSSSCFDHFTNSVSYASLTKSFYDASSQSSSFQVTNPFFSADSQSSPSQVTDSFCNTNSHGSPGDTVSETYNSPSNSGRDGYGKNIVRDHSSCDENGYRHQFFLSKF